MPQKCEKIEERLIQNFSEKGNVIRVAKVRMKDNTYVRLVVSFALLESSN